MGGNPLSCFSLGVGIASSRLKTWYLARHFAHLRGSAYFKGFQYHVDDSLTGQHIPANNRCGFCRVEHTCRRDYHLHWRQTALIAKKRIKKRAESLSFSFSCICLYFKGQGNKKKLFMQKRNHLAKQCFFIVARVLILNYTSELEALPTTLTWCHCLERVWSYTCSS